MLVKVELYGNFLGYVSHPSKIAELALEKGVGIEEAKDIKISYVQSPGVHILTKVRNFLIAERTRKAEAEKAKAEAEKVEAPKKRGRKKAETKEVTE